MPMSRQHLSSEEIMRRTRVEQWLQTAISVEDARRKKLVPLCNPWFLHQWAERIAMFEFAQRSKHAKPVLVLIRRGRATLYTERRKLVY